MRIVFLPNASGASPMTIRTHFEPGMTVVGSIVLLDEFGGDEREYAEVRMSSVEARSYAKVLTEMADMAERRPLG